VNAATGRVAVHLTHRNSSSRAVRIGKLHRGIVHISASQSRTVTPWPFHGARLHEIVLARHRRRPTP
jgi:hypothetical protein